MLPKMSENVRKCPTDSNAKAMAGRMATGPAFPLSLPYVVAGTRPVSVRAGVSGQHCITGPEQGSRFNLINRFVTGWLTVAERMFKHAGNMGRATC